MANWKINVRARLALLKHWIAERFPALNRWAERNWWTIKAVAVMVGVTVWVAGSVFVVASDIANRNDQEDRSRDNRTVLLEIRDQSLDVDQLRQLAEGMTNEEATLRQEQNFQRILDTADCNTVRRLNQLIRGMEDEGLLTPGRIVINC